MRIAFYAPLKSPDHPVASGDRQLARALVAALRTAGHEVLVASRFRSFDAHGDAFRQERLAQLGGRLAKRVIAHLQKANRPDLWFTYHLYHKAPDWLGPVVSAALDIPYVVAEASVAAKQRNGRWSQGYASSVAAVEAAAATLAFNPVDMAGIRNVRGAARAGDTMPPFLDLSAFVGPVTSFARACDPDAPVRLITVAMMRPGAKLASYQLLAAALTRIVSPAWELVVVGDGPARAHVEAVFAGIEARRVRFAGFQRPDRVAALMRESDLFLWPAIDEAFGMVFIEAQACGLPVVAGNAGGVGAVVAAGCSGTLVPVGDVEAFASATRSLLIDTEMRQRMGRDAQAYVRARHDLPMAAARIDALLRRVVAEHAAGAVVSGVQPTP